MTALKPHLFSPVFGRLATALLVAAVSASIVGFARADDTVTLSLAVKDRKYDPAELQAPAGKALTIRVKNLGSVVIEFESSDLHVEKIVPPGAEGVVRVRPQRPGRYKFFDDFHRETQGVLVVQ